MNYYNRHLGDYAKDTRHLSLAEHGAYCLLLDYYYSTEKPIPDDRCERIANAYETHERNAVRSVLEAFFTLTDAGWRNERADREIAAFRAKSLKAKESAEKRWSERNANAYANASETQCVGNAIQEPITNKEQRSKSLGQQAARFDEFWAVYPNRKGKAAALRTWQRKRLDALADRIIADVQARIAGDRKWLDGYIPHGSTYVNGEGWLDAIEPPRLRAVATTTHGGFDQRDYGTGGEL